MIEVLLFSGFSVSAAERTCEWLAEAIDVARQQLDFSLWAYVFMPEHVHLLVCPKGPTYEVAAILKAIKQPVGTSDKFLRQCSSPWLARISVKHGKKLGASFGSQAAGSTATSPTPG